MNCYVNLLHKKNISVTLYNQFKAVINIRIEICNISRKEMITFPVFEILLLFSVQRNKITEPTALDNRFS